MDNYPTTSNSASRSRSNSEAANMENLTAILKRSTDAAWFELAQSLIPPKGSKLHQSKDMVETYHNMGNRPLSRPVLGSEENPERGPAARLAPISEDARDDLSALIPHSGEKPSEVDNAAMQGVLTSVLRGSGAFDPRLYLENPSVSPHAQPQGQGDQYGRQSQQLPYHLYQQQPEQHHAQRPYYMFEQQYARFQQVQAQRQQQHQSQDTRFPRRLHGNQNHHQPVAPGNSQQQFQQQQRPQGLADPSSMGNFNRPGYVTVAHPTRSATYIWTHRPASSPHDAQIIICPGCEGCRLEWT